MGFSEAVNVEPGDRVIRGGIPRTVVAVVNSGRDWPYFQLESHAPTPFDALPVSCGLADWASWQTCGPVVRG